jgi:hypothetical protein
MTVEDVGALTLRQALDPSRVRREDVVQLRIVRDGTTLDVSVRAVAHRP